MVFDVDHVFLLDWPAECETPVISPITHVARVVNGAEAKPHSWPWQVSMQGFINPDAINDIALVRLAEPITNTPEISPVCLPKPEALMPAGHICYVTSWGDKKGTLKPVASRV
ncbi:hypothetical protein SRHO_G00037560 [Serrasalmus rhombeus]